MQQTYAYLRVSTKEQNIDRQMIAAREYGVNPKNIFVEKSSGKSYDRPQYRKLLKK